MAIKAISAAMLSEPLPCDHRNWRRPLSCIQRAGSLTQSRIGMSVAPLLTGNRPDCVNRKPGEAHDAKGHQHGKCLDRRLPEAVCDGGKFVQHASNSTLILCGILASLCRYI